MNMFAQGGCTSSLPADMKKLDEKFLQARKVGTPQAGWIPKYT